MLEHLRVLDLTDERGLLCGRLLADLGADVVQVEPPGGSTARQVPPTAGDRSLFWETFAAGKRGVVLDVDDAADRAKLRGLAETCDVLVTSWTPEVLEAAGLHPDRLLAERGDLVYVTISAFGWTGPKAGYAETDLVVWAAGGPLDPHRDIDLPPLRISVPQAYLHAAADAAAGAMLGVLARGHAGGQRVDVSAQASLGVATLARVLAEGVGDANPEWHKQPVVGSDQSGSGAATPHHRKKWRCADGIVELHLSMGPASGGFTNNLVTWLREEGVVDADQLPWDWREMPTLMARGEVTDDDIDRVRDIVGAFLATRTKQQVLDAAVRHRLLCIGIADVADVTSSPHLAARGAFTPLSIDGREVLVPGRIAHVRGRDLPAVRRRAPEVGEHQDEVLSAWLDTAAVAR